MHKRFLLNILLLCLCFVGCGTSDYEAKIGQRKAGGAPDALLPAEDLPGTRVSIRVARRFDSPALAEGAVDAKRVKPGIVTIPGWKRTCEGLVKDAAGGQMPFYCYIGVVEKPAGAGQNAADQLLAEVKKLPEGNAVQWADFQATSPEGRDSKWRMLRVTCPQDFYYKEKDGKDGSRSMPGILEVYVCEEAGFSVVMVWRLPTSLEQNIGLGELVKQMAGAVSVKQ